MRLVMPPTLFFILQLPFTNLAHALFPASVANGLICGAFTAYICYDCFHYLCDPHSAPSYRWDVS
jgi:4-hydroxysphinganine ceramide fatty acyl 2-hydroxylase